MDRLHALSLTIEHKTITANIIAMRLTRILPSCPNLVEIVFNFPTGKSPLELDAAMERLGFERLTGGMQGMQGQSDLRRAYGADCLRRTISAALC